MALTDIEKQIVIERLDALDDAAKEKVIGVFDAFVQWLMNVLYSIFLKVKNVIGKFWTLLVGAIFS